MNASCAATWLVLLRRVGFELVEVVRRRAEADPRFSDKLRVYEPNELRTDRLLCHVRRLPDEPSAELLEALR
jgi:hypothetical protein